MPRKSKGKRQNATRWVCQACGAETRGWYGKCPECGAWNTVVEELDLDKAAAKSGDRVVLNTTADARVVVSTEAGAGDGNSGEPRLPCGLSSPVIERSPSV